MPLGGMISVLLALALTASVQSSQIHKRMTLDELQSTFHVDHHDLVPEYEVVRIHHVSPRSVDHATSLNSLDGTAPSKKSAHLKLKAFGKPMSLSLAKTEGLLGKAGLRVWTVQPNASAQHGVEYTELPGSSEEIGEIYQDQANEAAILIRKDESTGEILVEGSIGSDLVVRPVPKSLRSGPELSDDEMYLDQDGDLSSEVAIDTGLPIRRPKRSAKEGSLLSHHIVYKRVLHNEDFNSDFAFMEPDHLAKRYRKRRSVSNATEHASRRSKREAPYIIYPEILVIVDYDGYRLHGGDNVQIKRYFISFWNGVDLRYKLLKGPRVRISIAGIIISRGRDATPYLERNRVGRDAIDSAAALTDMGKYLFRERRLPVYDIAVAITKLDMCRRQFAGDTCNRGTAGFAYVGGACVVNKRLEKVNSVAIIEDTGGFSGIIVAAHEVGHLLGAVHDGSPPPSYLGGPGAEKCRWEDGYIMSDLRHTERGFRWSPCSVSSFHHFLNGDTATCLFNSPHEDDSLPRVLPGKLLTLDAQCRKDRGTSACFKDDRVCAQLFCFDAGSGYCVAYRPAAEGSACGDGQYCLNGRCVAEHENIIPDYSQNTPSYIRRQDIGQANQGRPLFHDEDDITQPIYETTQPPLYPPQQHQYTTQSPYIQQHNAYGFYSSENPYTTTPPTTTTTTTTTTTPRPYFAPSPFYFDRQTQSPYFVPSSSPPPTSQHPFFKQIFSFSTTRSPYDFHNFGRPQSYSQFPTRNPPYEQTTKNPYVGDYYQLRKQTTKSPYDFANFGRPSVPKYDEDNYDYQNHNNYLKRSYDAQTYYASGSEIQNYTVPLVRTL